MEEFVPPGPGPWELETAHFTRPFPKFGLEAVIRGMERGFRYGTTRYGLLLSHFKIAIVNGFWYQQPVAFGAPEGAMGPPPKPILWLLTRLHPGMRARIATGAAAFDRRLWREDLKMWDETDKPAAVAAHQKLLAVEPAGLDDAALTKHLEGCHAHIEEMIFLHHKFTIPCVLPTGDFLAHVSEWTGKPAAEVLAALRGTSRISLGFSAAELDALAKALEASPNGKELLAGGDGALGTIEALRGADGAVGDAARAFFDAVWHRALHYGVDEPSCGEQPEMLVRAIRSAAAGQFKEQKDDTKARIADLRAAVPAPHQAQFDQLIDEARHINRLRDERGMYADCLAIGISRRALLETGRRLAERGLVDDPKHAVDLSLEEATAMLAGKTGVSKETLKKRVEIRTTRTVADCPPFLRAMPAPPPPASVLPDAARRGVRAVEAAMSNLFGVSDRASTKEIVRGISVNAGVYEGVARRIDDASQFDRLQQGDVLVTRATAPYFNAVLPLLGAIVTDRGGLLCHAAIVAREYGIPGIVGTKEATKLIPDGARVRVDGGSGEVTIL